MKAAPTCAVLLDITLGEENGLDLVRDLRAASDRTPVLVVTGDAALSRVREATDHDAWIAFKPVEQTEMVSFVERSLANPRTREAETLFAMVEHETREEIAAELGIAESTAKTHIESVYTKLGFHEPGADPPVHHRVAEPRFDLRAARPSPRRAQAER